MTNAGTRKSKRTGIGKRHHKRRHTSWRTYIKRIAGKTTRLQGKSTRAIGSMITDLLERVAAEASRFGATTKKQTMTTREIESAANVLCGGGALWKDAIAHGHTAVSNFPYKAFAKPGSGIAGLR